MQGTVRRAFLMSSATLGSIGRFYSGFARCNFINATVCKSKRPQGDARLLQPVIEEFQVMLNVWGVAKWYITRRNPFSKRCPRNPFSNRCRQSHTQDRLVTQVRIRGRDTPADSTDCSEMARPATQQDVRVHSKHAQLSHSACPANNPLVNRCLHPLKRRRDSEQEAKNQSPFHAYRRTRTYAGQPKGQTEPGKWARQKVQEACGVATCTPCLCPLCLTLRPICLCPDPCPIDSCHMQKQLVTTCMQPQHARKRVKTKDDHDIGKSETKAEPMMPTPGSTTVLG
jgi:hypothetical protein